jgi:Mg2+/Co2+ transporter CorB
MVLESGQYIPPKNRDILINLFDLEHITVEDVMTPRGMIECLDLRQPADALREQISTSYHTRLPVLEGDNERVVGVLHLRRVASRALEAGFEAGDIRELVARPYFIPADTQVYAQLQFFQENRQRMALVVDEYGELLGLVTVEDIIEELIGKFTTSLPESNARLEWDEEGSALVDGSQNLRELNRRLGIELPLEHLQDIPESDLSLRINGIAIEVVQAEDRMVRMARIYRPVLQTETDGDG